MSQTTVSLVKGENIEEMVKTAVKLVGGIETYVKKDEKIALKPNLMRGVPSEVLPGITTNLKVFESVLKLVKSQTSDIIIVESNAICSEGTKKFLLSGCKDLADTYGVRCLSLSESDYEEVDVPGGVYLKRMKVAKELRTRPLISIPVLKTHSTTVYSGALKNLFGLLVDGDKMKYHWPGADLLPHLTYVLPDINALIKPRLIVMDGIHCMEGQGPVAGTSRKIGVVLAGTDPVALDTVGTTIMDIGPNEVPHLVEAAKRGRGTMDLNKIDIKGGKIEDVKTTVVRAKPYSPLPYQDGSQMKGMALGTMTTLRWLGMPNASAKDILYCATFTKESPLEERINEALVKLAEENKIREVSPGRYALIQERR